MAHPVAAFLQRILDAGNDIAPDSLRPDGVDPQGFDDALRRLQDLDLIEDVGPSAIGRDLTRVAVTAEGLEYLHDHHS